METAETAERIKINRESAAKLTAALEALAGLAGVELIAPASQQTLAEATERLQWERDSFLRAADFLTECAA